MINAHAKKYVHSENDTLPIFKRAQTKFRSKDKLFYNASQIYYRISFTAKRHIHA